MIQDQSQPEGWQEGGQGSGVQPRKTEEVILGAEGGGQWLPSGLAWSKGSAEAAEWSLGDILWA